MLRTFILLLSASSLAVAQEPSGYLLVGVGSGKGKLITHAALGGEPFVRGPFGIGGELGLVLGHDSFAPLSLNGSYHLLRSSRSKFDPFVTAGYTAGFSLGFRGHFVNAGGGLTYWFRDHLGVRTEFRSFANSGSAYYVVRAGISFR